MVVRRYKIRQLLLGMTVFLLCGPVMALAPHPIYFSVDGSPAEEEVEVEGKHYLVKWDGKSLSIVEKPNGEDGNEEDGKPGSYLNRIRRFYPEYGGNGNGKNGNGKNGKKINGHRFGGNGSGNGRGKDPTIGPDEMPWWGGLIWLGILLWGIFVYYILWKLGILLYVFIGMFILMCFFVTWLNLKDRW